MKYRECICPFSNFVRDGSPLTPARADFSTPMECTPVIGYCHSVYSVVSTKLLNCSIRPNFFGWRKLYFFCDKTGIIVFFFVMVSELEPNFVSFLVFRTFN